MTDTLLWTLVAAQIAMGAFDTLYHHEMTERLAWRQSQAQELRLHAVRNGFYALIFLTLAWSEPQGWLALVLLGLLLIEIAITLWDFVEEDMTRRLPASERITHTLLALNYGAILVLLVPRLLGWAAMPTGFASASHGLGSLFLTASAGGVALFGVRDWLASRRLGRMWQRPAAPLAHDLGSLRRILVVGATGFIGERLIEALVKSGHEVIVHVRTPAKAAHLGAPLSFVSSLDQIPADKQFDAIVNLAGAPIADWPWTRANRFRILYSRVATARRILKLIDRLDSKPATLITASAVGWYGPRGDERLSELEAPGSGFGARVCRTTESEALRAASRGVRVVRLRIGLVLAASGGMLARLLPPFDLCAGGRMGSGQHWMSWIARDDLVRLVCHAIATPCLVGAVNATAPEPVRNRDFATALGRALWRPSLLPVPAFVLRFLARDMAEELLLSGQRVIPEKALASGFVFEHPDLQGALDQMLGAQRKAVAPVTPVAAGHAMTLARGDTR